MTQAPNIDGVLITWGDRLFYPGNRVVKVKPQPKLKAGAASQRAAAIRQRIPYLDRDRALDGEVAAAVAMVADGIARWADRFTPAAGQANALIDAHPYLGPGFELTPRTPDDAPALHGLFAFNYSALISLGLSASALSGLQTALPRLVRAVADQLFMDDSEALITDLLAYDEAEFIGQWPRTREGEAA